MLQGFSSLMGLMKNAQQLQERTVEMQKRLGDIRISVSSSDDLVTVEVSGDQKLISLSIAPELLARSSQNSDKMMGPETESLEEVLIRTVNQALTESRNVAAQEMSELAESMGVPGIQDALARLGQTF